MNSSHPIVFIVGSPRSGTTLFGEILGLHPDVAAWYEPYFMWDKYFRNTPHDERTAKDASPKVKQQIRHDFLRFQRKIKRPIIIDKSPRNSLKIPFILEIFPEARFIHILRDGRDVSLSINREWKKRERIITGSGSDLQFDFRQALAVVNEWLSRQPFILDHLRALWFETHGHLFNKARHLNRLRWNGSTGWGPRYSGWEEDYEEYSSLEFNALQWLNCVKTVRRDWDLIDERNKIEIRYEDLVSNTKNTIANVFQNLKMDLPTGYFSKIPKIKANNFNKWRDELSASGISRLKPLLNPLLEELDYIQQFPW